MTKLTTWIQGLIQYEPAIFSYSTVAVLLPILNRIFHWDTRQAAAAAAIATALAAILTATRARPVAVPVISGGAVAILSALTAWNLNVPGADVTAVAALISILLGGVASVRLTPLVKLREAARQQVSAGGST